MDLINNPKTLQEIVLEKIEFPIAFATLFACFYNESSVVGRKCLMLLHLASRCRKEDIVEAILSAVTELNAKSSDGNTVLHFASMSANKQIVEKLIKGGADVNAQNEKRYTALHIASRTENYKIVEVLIKSGAALNIQSADGHSALHLACESATSRCTETLITCGINVDLQNCYGQTALHCACQSMNVRNVNALIDAKANVNIHSNDDETALHFALPISCIYRPHFDTFLTLYKDAYDYLANYSKDVNQIVKMLIDAGIDVNHQCISKNTALHLAVVLPDNAKLVEALIIAGANVNKQNGAEKTALHFAHHSNNGRIVHILMKAGIDINKQDNNGNTALHLASRHTANKVVKELISAGADINKQNYLGQTALHLNIIGNCNLQSLEILITNGICINIKDIFGLDAIQQLQRISDRDAPLNVCRLQEHFCSYRDVYGNTIFHLMMKRKRDEDFWLYIRENQTHFEKYLRIHNMFGQTPLHVAACIENGVVETATLDSIFSSFDTSALDLLLTDEYGNTFLHTFMSAYKRRHHIQSVESFLMNLFEGKYKNCSIEMRTKLVNYTNRKGYTPFHLAVVKAAKYLWFPHVKLLVELFLKAGANINSTNSVGETILHALDFSNKTQKKTTKMLVENGADVNSQNILGESPIFILGNSWFDFSDEEFDFLMESGADLNVCNRFGQTALAVIIPQMFSGLKYILHTSEKSMNINQRDMFGSSLLHYIAWSTEIENCTVNECLRLSSWTDFTVHEDNFGQLPCDVAYSRGNSHVLSELCVCKNGVHDKKLVFRQSNILFQSLKQKDDEYQTFVQAKCQYFAESNITDIMHVPYVGLVNSEEDREAYAIKTAVVRIVGKICKIVGEKDNLLSNSVILSGSVAEKTKVGMPDEFDFLCVLDKISDLLDLEESDDNYIKANLKKELRGGACSRFFDSYPHFYLVQSRLLERFHEIIQNIVHIADLHTYKNILIVMQKLEKPRNNFPNFKLTFRASSCKFKNMTVSVDIVLACRIKGNIELKGRIRGETEELLMLFQSGQYTVQASSFSSIYITMHEIRVSASVAENRLFAKLPANAQNAYVISKILCCDRICPSVIDVKQAYENNEYDKRKCSSVISSYMLKNCLFHVVAKIPMKTAQVLSVHEYVCNIFETLLSCSLDENLPCYMFPWQNIFSFQSRYDQIGTRKICTNRALYAKIILNILGRNEEFTDINPEIDVHCCNEIDGTTGKPITNMSDFLYKSDLVSHSNICANCKNNPAEHGTTLKSCPRCRLWTYCSAKCREENWRRHKPACDYHYGRLRTNVSLQTSSKKC